MGRITHVGFADESNWNVGRFRSLGLVTVAMEHLDELECELGKLLDESGLKELKWQKLKGAKERFAAQKICRFVIDRACARQVRVDVLIWDIEDRRHKVRGRDDIANLQRMYFHLFRNVLRMRWPDDAVWCLHPDEHSAMNWQVLQDCLDAVSENVELGSAIFASGGLGPRVRQEFGIEEIKEIRSEDYPLLQVADLFAGLGVFSRAAFAAYHEWLKETSGQAELFEDESGGAKPSRRSVERFQVLKYLDDECKRRKLGVSLVRRRGLWTPNPESRINFWLYQPQHSEDTAPRREGRGGHGQQLG